MSEGISLSNLSPAAILMLFIGILVIVAVFSEAYRWWAIGGVVFLVLVAFVLNKL